MKKEIYEFEGSYFKLLKLFKKISPQGIWGETFTYESNENNVYRSITANLIIDREFIKGKLTHDVLKIEAFYDECSKNSIVSKVLDDILEIFYSNIGDYSIYEYSNNDETVEEFEE